MVDSTTLARRVINSTLVIILVGIVTFLFPNWVFTILASSLIGLSLNEFFGLVERKGIFVYKQFGIIIGMLVPVIVYFQMGHEGYFTLEPFLIVIACLFTFVLQFTRRDNESALSSISVTMFGLLYIAWLFSYFIKIKFMPGGALLVAFLISVTKAGDIGAFLVGTWIGKTSLIQRISPKKTIEGTIGGLVFSMIAALAGSLYLGDIALKHLCVLGILLGILAQVGDLAESLIKRGCGAKDSGSSLTGFGGVLDLIDSLIFTTPIFYFYMMVLKR